MYKYELKPTTRQKSFYGKAYVVVEDNEDKVLFSYNTKIMTMHKNGECVRHWGNKETTATTLKHIKAFSNMNKVEFLNLTYIN